MVAVIASHLAARMRIQAIMARERADTNEDLYRFSRKLAGAAALDDLLWATAYQIAHMLGLRVVLLLPEGESVAVRTGYPPEDILDNADLAAAKWARAWHRRRARRRYVAGRQAPFPPMATKRGIVGIIGLDGDGAGPLITPGPETITGIPVRPGGAGD